MKRSEPGSSISMSNSPMRLSLTAAFNPGPIPSSNGAAAAEQTGPRGLQLMRKERLPSTATPSIRSAWGLRILMCQ